MDTKRLVALQPYIDRQLSDNGTDLEERAKIENIVLDERPPEAGLALYGRYLAGGPIIDLDDWHLRHNGYVTEELWPAVDEAIVPWTLRPENEINRLRHIDPRLYLIRVEDASWPCSISQVLLEVVRNKIDEFNKGDAKALDFLNGFLIRWNTERQQRPLYATTMLEVEDIFEDDSPDWTERLRDRLGLGHYSPGPADRPIEVLVMRYTVQDVITSLGGSGYPAIPTVLDGRLSGFFFPRVLPLFHGRLG